MAGPPCQPWAGNGRQLGTADARASVMDTCVGWIISQAWQGQLLAFAVENSPRLRGTAYLRELLQRLQVCIPMFVVSVEVHDLCQLCPQHRERLWIRGLRRDCLRGLPGLPPPLTVKDIGGKVSLETVLDQRALPIDPRSLCQNMQCNLAAYVTLVQRDIEKGYAGEVAVMELDRNLKEFGGGVAYDCTPPVRTKGPKLWLLRTKDVKEHRPWQEHSLHRYMLPAEKALLQGHEPRTPWLFGSLTQAEKAVGNAYHPLQLGVTLCPLLEIAFLQGKLKTEPQTMTQEELWQLTPPPEAVVAAQLSEDEDMLEGSLLEEPAFQGFAEGQGQGQGAEVHPAPRRPLPIKVETVKLQAVKLEPGCKTWAAGTLKMEKAKRAAVVNLASPQRRVRQKTGDC